MGKGSSNGIAEIPLFLWQVIGGGWAGTVLPVMFASCDSKLGSTLIAIGAVTPRRLLGQHICNTAQD